MEVNILGGVGLVVKQSLWLSNAGLGESKAEGRSYLSG